MKTVLIVEDDALLLQALKKKFEKKDFFVLCATDGEEGLSLALSRHPDCILLDILMPKMDGLAVYERLKSDPWGKKVPVIFLTNLSVEANAMVAALAKKLPEYYLVKSDVDIDTVVSKVEKVLSL